MGPTDNILGKESKIYTQQFFTFLTLSKYFLIHLTLSLPYHLKTIHKSAKFETLMPFCLFFAMALERIFIKTHSIRNRCYRTGRYTVFRRVCASFSLDIFFTGWGSEWVKGKRGLPHMNNKHKMDMYKQSQCFRVCNSRQAKLIPGARRCLLSVDYFSSNSNHMKSREYPRMRQGRPVGVIHSSWSYHYQCHVFEFSDCNN